MPITISKASWHALLYKWFYRVYSMPRSLCPYFWELSLAIILLIPVILMSLPAYCVIVVFKSKRDWIVGTRQANRISQSIVGVILYACMYACYYAIWGLIHIVAGQYCSIGEQWGLFIVGTCTVIMLVIMVSESLKHHRIEREDRLFNEWHKTHPNKYFSDWKWETRYGGKKRKAIKDWLIILAIKAWYEKSCPIIDWKP